MKHWRIVSLILWIAGIILLLPLLAIYYTALHEVTEMAIFPHRHDVFWLSLLGFLLIIIGGIISFMESRHS